MSDVSEAPERALKLELMAMDLLLKRNQAFWETPRNIAILMTTVAAIAGALGYKFGASPTPAAPIVVYMHDGAAPKP